MNEHPTIVKLQRVLGILYQRASQARRESDAVDIQEAFKLSRSLQDTITAHEMRNDDATKALDVMKGEYDVLLNAVLDADEAHPLVSELAEAIRKEEWAESEADGVMSPNEMAEKLNILTGYADQEAAAVVVRAMMGDALPADGLNALVTLTWRITWEHKP